MISVAGVLCALVGSAYAASATVMSFEGGEYVKGEIAPLGWYPYKTPEKGNTASIDTATAKTYKYIEAMVSKTTESSAGVSLNWKANDKAIDLSAYKGICATANCIQWKTKRILKVPCSSRRMRQRCMKRLKRKRAHIIATALKRYAKQSERAMTRIKRKTKTSCTASLQRLVDISTTNI